MKINGVSSASPTNAPKRAAAKGGSKFEPAEGSSSARRAAATGATVGVGSIDALLALQGEDLDDRRERAAGRAFSLLDILDDIKIALLEGGVPRSKLNALLGVLSAARDDTGDSQLETALDEVETRARVELAKHESALF